MSNQSTCTGIPVWREIVAGDGKKVAEFYTKLFSWKATEEDMGPGAKYTMFHAGEKPVAGVQVTADVPPHWIRYFTVADVDEAAEIAESAGGKVIVSPTDIPNIGRFCVVEDPQGAVSCPFKGASESADPPTQEQQPGDFCWEELMTSDENAAVEFYQKLYGWQHEKMDMAEGGTYHIMKAGDKGVCGIMRIPAEAAGTPAHFIPYVDVSDVDGSADEATKLGAKVYVAPRDIPGMGRFAVIADSVGATVAFYMNAKK